MNQKTYRIVLAEDNPADVYLVRTALQQARLSFDLVVLQDGAMLLEYFENLDREGAGGPDLLLLDLSMPKWNGQEILERVRTMPAGADTVVIVITSSAHPKDRQLALALKVAHYFCKPADFDAFMEIGAIVKDVLSRDAREN